MMLSEIAPDNPALTLEHSARVSHADRAALPDLASWHTAHFGRSCPHCGADDGCRYTRDGDRHVWACRHQLDHLAEPPVSHDGAGFTIFRDPDQHRRDVSTEVLRTIRVLRPEGLTEVRVLGLTDNRGKSFTASGYFDDPRKAARAAIQYEARRPAGIYLLLNEPDPALFARSPNKMTDYPKATTSDQDIVRRRWLLLDLDPKRPSGVGSNPRQLASAEKLARECRDLLCGAGWPTPVEGMSGNGAYLLFGLDLPNDAETTTLATDVLKAINYKVGLTGVPPDEPLSQVDLTTFNAARVVRLLGTMNRKGHPTLGLPHRRSRLLAVPERIEPVSVELLHAAVRNWSAPTTNRVTARVTPPKSAAPTTATVPAPSTAVPAADYRHRLKVDTWLTDRGFGFTTKPGPDCHGRTVYLLDRCPFDASHGGTKEVAVYQTPDGKLGAACKHNSCTGKGWREFKVAIGVPDSAHYDPPLAPRSAPLTSPPTVHEHATDLGNARRLVKLFGSDLRHCHPWGKDMVWDGRRWVADDTAQVERYAKDTVRSIYTELTLIADPDARARLAKHAAASESARAIGAMIRLSRSEPTVPVRPTDLDRDVWALNVANGTLDLRTGVLRPHLREDLLTRLAPVAFDPTAACPMWEAFLEEIMGKKHLVEYMQRVVGYALTGSVIEQVLWVLYGEGANGKSTFLNTVITMLGDLYAMQAVPELVMARSSEAHPTERADLFGRRLVACVETEQGRRLAESLVKQLTGGERVRARRMREDFWEFDPTHKLFLVTNHKPTILGDDKGIWRRVKLLPFTVTIPDAKKDPALPEKLKAELPGILAWAVRGCLEWQRNGLGHPPEVEEATKEYRAEMDTVGAFLAECCVTGLDEFRVRKTDLYAAFASWAAKSGDAGIGRNDFNRRLAEIGYKTKRSASNGAEQWHGLALRSEVDAAERRALPAQQDWTKILDDALAD